MNMRMKNLSLAVICCLGLAACDITVPSQIRTGEIRLKEDMKTQSVDLYHLNENHVSMMAAEYNNIGRGPMSVTVAYPEGDVPEKIAVENRGAALRDMLSKNKVTRVSIDYVPVSDKRLSGNAVVSYPALMALAPENCSALVGAQGGETLQDMEHYQVSCANKDMLSRMIAHPQDLMGVTGAVGGPSRSAGALMEAALDGTPNEPFFDQASASELGGQ